MRNLSISKYVNVDGHEVLLLKSVKETETKKNWMLKAYIKKEGVWSEIESDSQQSLSDKAKHIEREAKITLQDEMTTDRLLDTFSSVKIHTIDKIKNNIPST